MSSELENLRKEIENIDKQIVELLAKRLKISMKIGEIKNKIGKSVTDEKREEVVKNYWIENAKIFGLPESLVNSILPLIFSYSKLYQINPGQKRNVTIIGYGGMARSLVSLLSLAGHNVVVTGRDRNKASALANEFKCVYMNLENALKWGELIILALPPVAIEYIRSILSKPVIRDKIVMDIFSSKDKAFKELEEMSIKHSFKFVSTHPLFGPILYPVGERIAIIPSKSSEDSFKEVVEFWKESGLVPVITTVEEHEKAMAIVQVLSHFYILGLSRSIESAKRELEIDKISDLQTTNFREILKIINRVNELYPVIIEIQNSNPYAYKVREIGVKELQELDKEIGEKT
ncbi:chorismate mutase [Sulfolobaceae archaeon RB850M]